jgi:hypothetical protein
MDVVVNGITKAPAQSKSLLGQGDFYQNILLCLGFEPQHLPLADLLKLYHHLSGQWLIATPVHWQATHNDAMLVADAKGLFLSEQESRLWFNEVANFLEKDDFTPVYHDAHTWLFKIESKPPLCSKSVHTILNQSLMPVLNSLDSSFYWQRLITEIQMYLSAHPLNLRRESGLAVNGLWFWGEGDFQIKETGRITTDDEVLLNWSATKGQSVKSLSTHSVFDKDELVIIQDLKPNELQELQEKIKNNQVNWHWNNCSYSTQAKSWWSRLWS